MTHVCPVCGGDRDAGKDEALVLLREIGEYDVNIGPGGTQIVFREHVPLTLTGECDTCDLKRVREFFDKHRPPHCARLG